MRLYKNFTKTDELTPVQRELSENCSIQFIHDESGVDWYILQKTFQDDTLKIQYDNKGLIIAADDDVSKLFPIGCSVVELKRSDIPDGFQPGQFTFDGGKISPVKIDYIAVATIQRDKCMAAATVRINQLVESRDDGDITVDEELMLVRLREYRSELRRLDLSLAPDITFPEEPQ